MGAGMIYFIHDRTSRAIKIGCSRDPSRRLATLQTSTTNELILLGAIAGTERTEKKVHALVCRHCAPKPGEPPTRPLRLQGEWFDDRILPFVLELIGSPKKYLGDSKKPLAASPAPAVKDPALHQCTMALLFDSGEQYQEHFILKAASPDLAMAALGAIADARLAFLASTVRITELSVPGRPSRKISLQGGFATQNCSPREGLSVVFNSEPGNGCATLRGVKQYSLRWLHGVPGELRHVFNPWQILPTAQLEALLQQFARVLTRHQCLTSTQNPLPVKGLIPREFGPLPKGELRSKANKKAAEERKRQRPPEKRPRPTDGVVYFIQDMVSLAIKIGFCLRAPEKRLAALRTGTANALRLLGHVLGSPSHERRLHAALSRFRLQGEWFSGAVLADVEAILKCKAAEEWLTAQGLALAQQAPPAGVGEGGGLNEGGQ
jgi:hypothetical protein